MLHPILITGAAGFIGFHVARRLLQSGRHVVGVDSLNSYYDPRLKHARLELLRASPLFRFVELDLADREQTAALFAEFRFPEVIHLAAQAGVRHSIDNPAAYVDANLQGFGNVLEGCRHHGCGHLLFASSSSVYGLNAKLPFSVHDNTDHPISMYAATKKANEAMAHSYSHLYGLPATGLRFFTVYGPWGRPDMAMYLFARAIDEGRPIKLFNHGNMRRDFTYIDDVTDAIQKLIARPPHGDQRWASHPDPATSSAPWQLYNIGNNKSEELLRIVGLLEKAFGKPVQRELLPMQPGDVLETCADIDSLIRDIGFRPTSDVEGGIERFAKWYRDYHKV